MVNLLDYIYETSSKLCHDMWGDILIDYMVNLLEYVYETSNKLWQMGIVTVMISEVI